MQAAEDTDRYLSWCEDHEYDPDDPATEDVYLDFVSGLWEEPDDEPEDHLDWWELEPEPEAE